MKKKSTQSPGFTLIEVLIAIIALVSLALLCAESTYSSIQESDEANRRSVLLAIASAKMQFQLDNIAKPAAIKAFNDAAPETQFNTIQPYLTRRGITARSIPEIIKGTGANTLAINNIGSIPTF